MPLMRRTLGSVGLGAALGAATGYVAGLLLGRRNTPSASTSPGQAPVTGTGPSPETAPGCPPGGTRVLLLGDSHAQGLGPPMAALALGCSTPFAHRAVVGSHVTQWAQDSWLLPALASIYPTVVLVSLGANDFLRTDPANVSAGITALVSQLHAAGVRVLWIAPITEPFPDKIGVGAMWQASVEDWYDSTKLEIPRYGDGTHATPAGYKTWAGELWPWMCGLLQHPSG
jgi:lysophospholipase L1-like esterase